MTDEKAVDYRTFPIAGANDLLIVDKLCRPGMPSVSFDVGGGDCLAVMGPSGSGKTLLLRAVADLDPSEGSVSLDNESKETVAPPEWRRRISYVAAEPGWWAATPADHFDDWTAAQTLAEALLLPPTIGNAPIAQLSTGERLRLALIRALVGSPRFLLLDEPTGALDSATTEAVETILRRRMAGGTGIVLVTHDSRQADRLADNVLGLENGHAELRAA